MSTRFNTVLQDDAQQILSADGELAESVVYTPRNGDAKSYYAHVVRDPPRRNEGDPIVRMEVRLARDPAGEKGPASIDTGGDTITVAYRLGGTAAAHLVGQVARQDAGSWVLRIF